jgi:hypothetical protein
MGEGKRTASGAKQVPAGPKRVYGGAKTADDLAAGTEKAAIRQSGTRGKEGAATAVPYPGGAENAAARKSDAKGRAAADQPGQRGEGASEPGSGRQTDMKGGEPALERAPALRNIPEGEGAQRGVRRGVGGTMPRSDTAEESLKKGAPPSGENAGGSAGSVGNQPGTSR